MARRLEGGAEFQSLSVEGGLLPPDWFGRIAALAAPQQDPADYRLPKGLGLRDEIGRYWRIASALWAEFQAGRAGGGSDSPAAARAFVRQFLVDVLGFHDLTPGAAREAGGRTFEFAFEAVGGTVPIAVGPPREAIDQRSAHHGGGGRKRSAFGSLQEYLNAADGVLWGVATNGLVLRVARDNASLTRPAWIEADLERIFAEDRFADFSVLWLLAHATRFGRPGGAPFDCVLELWRTRGREDGTRARDQLRNGVTEALEILGDGFLRHEANRDLRAALASGALSPSGYFNELLRLVYRLIFLLTVEERGILHPPAASLAARRIYQDGYGLRRLRDRALRAGRPDHHDDLWAGLAPVFAGLGRAEGEPLLGLPGLGGIFGADQCPMLAPCRLSNRHLLRALFRLGWLRDQGSLARVNWKDMGPEELGSVYESLLELVPRVSGDGRRFSFAPVEESAGNTRKLTGSYYTPDELVQQLLDTALEPVIAARLASRPDSAEAALLSLRVVDPACGSGHFLLAASRRLAGRLAQLRAEGTATADEYRHALRDVVNHCIHGVDRNPMALELARMALWLEAFTPDRALGFLDHHLACGDALLGLIDLGVLRDGVPAAAFKALTGDDKAAAKRLGALNRAGAKALEAVKKGQLALDFDTAGLGQAFADLDQADDGAVEDVEAKRARFRHLESQARKTPLAVAADLVMAAFLSPVSERTEALVPTSREVLWMLDGSGVVPPALAAAARSVCREASVLHWRLAFPQVFSTGGFDVVLGNPPWERIKLQEQEFFATRAPAIAEAPNKAARDVLIRELEAAEPGTPEAALHSAFIAAKRAAEGASVFCHQDIRYPLTGTGDVNTYALFAETALRIVAPGGRCGLVVPTGIATDDSTKAFFGHLSQGGRLVSLYDFENRDGIFPAVDSRQKFSLLTIGAASQAEFAFFATKVSDLQDSRRRFRLGPADFALINPNTLTCPVFRSEMDAELTKKIYARVPVLIDESKGEEGNPWGLSFTRLFDMSNDSHLFATAPGEGLVPLYEAKMIHQFDHRWASYGPDGAAADVPDTDKADPDFEVTPRYWVPRSEVEERLDAKGWKHGWLMGWRDIARATDERTVIASLLPAVGVGNKIPLMLAHNVTAQQCAALLANLSSLTCDYAARQKVGGTTLNYFIYRQLPLLPPTTYSPDDLAFLVPRVAELTCTSNSVSAWAEELGAAAASRWDPERRAALRAEIDAWFARRYGLRRDDLRFVLDPADLMGQDYPTETFRVLRDRELRECGEYRSRRLILDAWDRLFGGGS